MGKRGSRINNFRHVTARLCQHLQSAIWDDSPKLKGTPSEHPSSPLGPTIIRAGNHL
jgi:hypothetical protein